ncbi:MAG: hypothetical protein ACHP83_13880 [Burkholderiales bacterium]|jgi:hypothetical protein
MRAAGVKARRRALLWITGFALPMRSQAQALRSPSGAVVLSVGGRIQRTNQGERAMLDMAMLEGLAQQSFTTKTPWFKQPRKFTGPLLRDVLSLVGAQGATLRIAALNDYRIDVPSEDTRRFDVLLARLIDDKPITVREKGPLFMIYPFDSDAALRNPLYYSRSVWQLNSIDVL